MKHKQLGGELNYSCICHLCLWEEETPQKFIFVYKLSSTFLLQFTSAHTAKGRFSETKVGGFKPQEPLGTDWEQLCGAEGPIAPGLHTEPRGWQSESRTWVSWGITWYYGLYFRFESPFQLSFYQAPQKNFAEPLPVFKALQKFRQTEEEIPCNVQKVWMRGFC